MIVLPIIADQRPDPVCQDRFVTAYASAHPLENWAETWTHYLHLLDTLETACAFGLATRPGSGSDPALNMAMDFVLYGPADFDTLVRAWLPLTYAVNDLNRSMGQPDLYHFVVRLLVLDKLRLLHDFVREVGV